MIENRRTNHSRREGMKIKPMIIAVPVMFTLLTGCTWDSQNPNLGSLWPFKHNNILNVASNGEIIQELITINKTEITLLQFAKTHSSCPKIRKLAALLQKEHTRNLRTVQHLSHQTKIAPVMNAMSTHIEHQGRRELAELKTLHNDDFNRAFLRDMISDHQSAIQIIDSDIMQSTNAQLTAYLKTTREHVVMHLHKIEALQQKSNR